MRTRTETGAEGRAEDGEERREEGVDDEEEERERREGVVRGLLRLLVLVLVARPLAEDGDHHEALVRHDRDDAEEDADGEARLELAHDDRAAHGDEEAEDRRPDRREAEPARALAPVPVRDDGRGEEAREHEQDRREPRVRDEPAGARSSGRRGRARRPGGDRAGSLFRQNSGDAGAALLRVLLEREAQDIVDEFLGFLHNCPRRALLRRGWGGRMGGLGFEACWDRVRLRVGASAFPDSFARLSSARTHRRGVGCGPPSLCCSTTRLVAAKSAKSQSCKRHRCGKTADGAPSRAMNA